jgi:hypothetical protein
MTQKTESPDTPDRFISLSCTFVAGASPSIAHCQLTFCGQDFTLALLMVRFVLGEPDPRGLRAKVSGAIYWP